MKFIIEASRTPIYHRIALAITKNLLEMGHEVYFIETQDFNNRDFIETINDVNVDYYITTNDYNFIQKFEANSNKYIFQEIQHKIIFLHHDSSFCGPDSIEKIDLKIEALKLCQSRVFHFFIEKSNIQFFNEIGINNCFPIDHASEFNIAPNSNQENGHDISFVGHLMSSLSIYPRNSLALEHHMLTLAYQRLSHSSFAIQPEIMGLITDDLVRKSFVSKEYSNLAIFQFLMHEVTKLSMAYRGEIINTISTHSIDVYGGDLSYGKINNPLMKLDKPNIFYHPATSDYNDTAFVYNKSRLSLNISSLQFDSAINNRIIDVVLSGGFILSDNRSDLALVSQHAKFFTFETPEDLQHLIEFHLNPANKHRHLELKNAIYEEFKARFTYKNVLGKMLRNLSDISKTH